MAKIRMISASKSFILSYIFKLNRQANYFFYFAMAQPSDEKIRASYEEFFSMQSRSFWAMASHASPLPEFALNIY